MRMAMRAQRGEFHACVYAGPMLAAPLPHQTGEIAKRERFVFADFSVAGT